ncbi:MULTISPECIES: NO-inducible flavohemoprotein [Bacillaceae]|uniref:NO-inducible flavohemoprotein n=1 Tax=Bacillales TaxID=1385 RepID=UPI0018839F56|nr:MULTISPECIES: NO-inducible flavohemoprotein [Bacillaceae]MBF0707760.1 NO-inducible flavohemoprotein [Pseudalkalibacillus hwajinpoensis]MDO6654466.1 NO-inducible flavohemoprotein [Anaerobacillus sp. 1_MG-2023]
MLNENTIKVVKSTAPVLQEHSQEIGERFYELLFSRVPDLYNMFNQTNQKLGTQQGALAYGVYLAGANIDNLEEIESMVERVTEKHRALGVQPEQYPIVGETLLEAVKDVLGDTATDEIIDAWGEAYTAIADIFIKTEAKLYEQTDQKQGGWIGNRSFYVDRKVKESDVITSFYLKPEDGGPIASYKPGQYLTLEANIEGEQYSHMRHYSLSDAPNKDYYRISVKREDAVDDAPAGIVSNYLHHDISEGDTLSIAAPAGDFTYTTDDQPIVLISGGVGITPMLSMLNSLVENGSSREITFIHAAQNSNVHAIGEHVEKLANENSNVSYYVCYSDPTEQDRAELRFDKEGLIDLDWLQSVLSDHQKDFYFCGPLPFLKSINESLKEWGVPAERRHYELFSPVSTIEEE